MNFYIIQDYYIYIWIFLLNILAYYKDFKKIEWKKYWTEKLPQVADIFTDFI